MNTFVLATLATKYLLQPSSRGPASGVRLSLVIQRAKKILGPDFDQVYTACVREVLTSLFGETACSTVLRYIEDKYSLNMHNLSRHPGKLHAALLDLFGSGAEVIREEINKQLRQQLRKGPLRT